MKSVSEAAFKMAEAVRGDYVVEVEPDTTEEDLLRADFWTHIARRLRPWDEIDVRYSDGSRLLRVVVQAAENLWAKVAIIAKYEFPALNRAQAVEPTNDPELEAKWKGQTSKWCVVRKSDGKVLQEGGQHKDDSHAWIIRYRMTVPLAA